MGPTSVTILSPDAAAAGVSILLVVVAAQLAAGGVPVVRPHFTNGHTSLTTTTDTTVVRVTVAVILTL